MRESLLKITKSKAKGKKYTAIVRDKESGRDRAVHFGAVGYGQFKDSTPLKAFAAGDHGDSSRRRSYFLRHSGVSSKTAAVRKERARGVFTPKLLAHMYLW